MVELELVDYKTILQWFELAFAKKETSLSVTDRKVFWKLHFLAEDKMKEEKMNNEE